MAKKIKRPNKDKKSEPKVVKVGAAKFGENVEKLKDMIDKDVNKMMFNVDIRDKKPVAYVLAVLYDDGWIHVIRPEPVSALRILSTAKERTEADIKGE